MRDHNKKTRKEARKTDQKSKLRINSKKLSKKFTLKNIKLKLKESKKKNIVIPNKFPLKEEILLMSEKQKQAVRCLSQRLDNNYFIHDDFL